MKFISLILFLTALSVTWSLSRQSHTVAESIHVGIQEDLKNIIKTYIEDNVEGVKDITFTRMWSETLDASKIKAHFIYAFTDLSNTRMELDGHAILNKLSETPEEVKFSFDELFIHNQSVVFDEPMQITAGSDDMSLENETETPSTSDEIQ